MKRILVILGIVVITLTTKNIISYASEVETTNVEEELPSAGVKPGSFLYGIDKFFERVSINVTYSNDRKAEKLSQIALERLAELNELNPELAQKYADELFDEYGLNIEKAKLYIQRLVDEGKISEERLTRIANRYARIEQRKEYIKNQMNQRLSQVIDLEVIENLRDEGYGYGSIIKLQAISELSSKSINELLLIENVVSINEYNEKVIDFDVLLESLQLTREDLKVKLSEYHNSIKARFSDSHHFRRRMFESRIYNRR